MEWKKVIDDILTRLKLTGTAKYVRDKLEKKVYKKLQDDYRGALSFVAEGRHKGPSTDDVWMAVERSIPLEYKEVHNIIRQYWKAAPREKGPLFAMLCDALNEIAPRGCQFTRRYDVWGFWEKDIY
jgi:hypothetical protein